MDWRNDTKTRDIGDQFMFGPSILVSPGAPGGRHSQNFVSAGFPGMVRFLDRNAHSRVDARLMRRPLWTAFHSTYVQVRFFLSARKSSTPTKNPQDRSNFGFTAEPMANSTYTRTRAMTTNMKTERTRSSRFIGRSQREP